LQILLSTLKVDENFIKKNRKNQTMLIGCRLTEKKSNKED